MTKEDEIKNEIAAAVTPPAEEAVVPAPAAPKEAPAEAPRQKRFVGQDRGGKRGGGRGGRGPRRGNFERAKPEFDQKMIDIRRVARVVAGGRRFSFAVVIVIGDRKGSVGVGTGKAGDTSLAIEKGFRDARKNMIKLELTQSMSIPHEVMAKYSSANILLKPNRGKGLVVGSSARTVLNMAGIKDVSAKILSGSKNKLNIAQATIKALSLLGRPRGRAAKSEVKNIEGEQKG